jgi:hypothetical protein
MFRFFKRSQIDTEKWDDCINLSGQSIIYAMSWYLDIVSPEWGAFIKEDQDKYVSVFPVAIKRKYLINYVFQPPFTQQLGLFSKVSNNDQADLHELLTTLTGTYNYIDYNFNAKNILDLNVPEKVFLKNKITHHLHLQEDYTFLFKAFSENHKRNIKKSISQNLKVKDSENINGLISLFKEEIGKDLKKIKDADYKILSSLFTEARKRNAGKLLFSEDINGEIQAGGFFLTFNNNITYIFGASAKRGKQNGSMSMIFNEVIRENSGTGKVLDFEGSDIESIARFYRSFGSQPVPYVSLKFNNLPFFIKAFKK